MSQTHAPEPEGRRSGADKGFHRWGRLRALGSRVSEARELGVDARSQVGYLAAHYWARLANRAPFELPRLELPVTVRAYGRDVRAQLRTNGADWGLLRNIFLHGEYKTSLPEAEVTRILDLGANCGFASLYFATCFPRADILAIEPMPRNADACRRHFAANGVRGEVVEAACARDDGFADLLMTEHDGCHSLVPFHSWNDVLRVKTLSVPTLLARKGWDAVDIFKVDIEGYEKLLFQDSPAWLERVRVIVGELHGDYGQPELQRDLAPYAFTVRTLSVGYETTFIATR